MSLKVDRWSAYPRNDVRAMHPSQLQESGSCKCPFDEKRLYKDLVTRVTNPEQEAYLQEGEMIEIHVTQANPGELFFTTGTRRQDHNL